MANPILSSMHIAALILSFLLFFILGMSSAQLSKNFYETSCPEALSIIKLSVHSTVQTEPRMGASLLRLHFFDCFINGCDGSILLDDTANFTGEKSADPIRGSIRGYDVIDNIKAQLENSCPDVVSCADILTVVARDSVVELGGPTWKVLLGRRDSTTASLSDANMDIPGPASNLSQLISAFSKKGFSVKEMVALAGAHTIGKARCTNFRNRIYNDTNINAPFARSMQAICPPSGGDNNLASLDSSSTSFDNVYFNNLLSQKGLMHSDQELFNGGFTDSLVKTYSSNPSTFASDFANAMAKMDNLSPLTGSNGQIRKNCRKIN